MWRKKEEGRTFGQINQPNTQAALKRDRRNSCKKVFKFFSLSPSLPFWKEIPEIIVSFFHSTHLTTVRVPPKNSANGNRPSDDPLNVRMWEIVSSKVMYWDVLCWVESGDVKWYHVIVVPMYNDVMFVLFCFVLWFDLFFSLYLFCCFDLVCGRVQQRSITTKRWKHRSFIYYGLPYLVMRWLASHWSLQRKRLCPIHSMYRFNFIHFFKILTSITIGRTTSYCYRRFCWIICDGVKCCQYVRSNGLGCLFRQNW